MSDNMTIRDMLSQHSKTLADIAGEQFAAKQIEYAAMTIDGGSSSLRNCKPDSIVDAVVYATGLGLLIGGPEQHAYLVPRGGAARVEIGWRGLVKLAYESGKVSTVEARLVGANDEFSIDYGSPNVFSHRPVGITTGEIIGVYAAAWPVDSTRPHFEYMSKAEVDEVAQKTGGGVWKQHWGEMARKTVIKRLAKRLPMLPVMHEEAARDDAEVGKAAAQAAPPPPSGSMSQADDMAASLGVTPSPAEIPTDMPGMKRWIWESLKAKHGAGAKEAAGEVNTLFTELNDEPISESSEERVYDFITSHPGLFRG